MPQKEADAADWLNQKFAVEKEALLGEFEKEHCFPGPDRSTPLSLPILLVWQVRTNPSSPSLLFALH